MTTPPQPPTPPSPAPAEAVEKPPLKWLLGYRVLGLRLPPQYRPWVAKDVTSKGFLTRRVGRSLGWAAFFLLLYYVVQSAVYEPPMVGLRTRFAQAAMILFAICLLASGATLVRHTLRWQRIDRHGRPVAPKPKSLAFLDNEHALILGALVVVLFMGASAIFADTVVAPDGPARERCRDPKTATMARIRAGLKNQSTKIENAQEIRFADSSVVTAVVEGGGIARKGVFFVVTPNEIFELALGAERVTSYEQPPTQNLDRTSGEAIRRAVECLRGKLPLPKS